MGDWGGAPEGWIPPEERAEAEAAAEAAAAMSERRELDDQRTAALAEAIGGGFAMLADALMLAAGVSDERRQRFFGEDDPADRLPGPPAPFIGGPPIRPPEAAPVDDGIDDILDDGVLPPHDCEPPAVPAYATIAHDGTNWVCSCGRAWQWRGAVDDTGRAEWIRLGTA